MEHGRSRPVTEEQRRRRAKSLATHPFLIYYQTLSYRAEMVAIGRLFCFLKRGDTFGHHGIVCFPTAAQSFDQSNRGHDTLPIQLIG
jgi:hypothetical protein